MILRRYPIERGKFKILNDVFFKIVPDSERPVGVQKLSYRIKMNIDAREFLQSHLFLYGSYELPTVKYIRSVAKEGMTFIDVGAQIGYLTLVMATANNKARVHSVEPEPVNIRKLRDNIALNSLQNVTVHEVGLSDQDGVVRLYLSNDHNAGTHSTVQNLTNVSEEYVDIDCLKLDTLVSSGQITGCDLIKIDVEGGELEVINGAFETLNRFHPTVIMELSDELQEARQFSTVQFKTLMQSLGYQSFTIANDGSLVESAVNVGHAMENVVFVHSSKL